MHTPPTEGKKELQVDLPPPPPPPLSTLKQTRAVRKWKERVMAPENERGNVENVLTLSRQV